MGKQITLEEAWSEFIHTRLPEPRNRLITGYIPFVRFVVGRLGIPPTGLLDTEDLVSYGMIGLINAIDRFDPSRGVRFEAFATPRIRGAVIDQLRSLNWLPRSISSRVRHIEYTLAHLEQDLGRPAREEEAANAMGVTPHRYRQMLLEANTTIFSLDAPPSSQAQDDELTTLGDLLEDRDDFNPLKQAEQHELLNALRQAIERLPRRERLLLALYYQQEMTMKQISKIMGVSESRICQLHIQAVTRLRGMLSAYLPEEEIGRKQKIIPPRDAKQRRNKEHVATSTSDAQVISALPMSAKQEKLTHS
ncbi:MAG: FliA/WhiG family RNA polymerase sigma factor [Ktedonobacteraceae bacterium]|nr:FliA/WhiG family RNA polymerase sigma factor [Ktedonobacteraceae bacterium]